MRLAGKVAQPISKLLPVDAVVGVGEVTVLAALVLVSISFVAGFVARTNAGKRIMRWSENSLLGGLPQYQLVKSMAEGLAQVENAESVHPALISIEGGWQSDTCLSRLRTAGLPCFCRRHLLQCRVM